MIATPAFRLGLGLGLEQPVDDAGVPTAVDGDDRVPAAVLCRQRVAGIERHWPDVDAQVVQLQCEVQPVPVLVAAAITNAKCSCSGGVAAAGATKWAAQPRVIRLSGMIRLRISPSSLADTGSASTSAESYGVKPLLVAGRT
jgi:hypothetical protein